MIYFLDDMNMPEVLLKKMMIMVMVLMKDMKIVEVVLETAPFLSFLEPMKLLEVIL